jgi:RimJ/RimL family protein N-acetyltransferase
MGKPSVYAAHVSRSGIPYIVREATESDADGMVDYKSVVFRETELLLQSYEDFVPDSIDEAHLLRRCRLSPNSVSLIAERGGRIVGNLTLFGGPYRRNRHVGQIGMGVLRAFWGIGIGGAMLDEAIRWAEGNPYIQKLSLQVYQTNDRAIRLYLRKGFAKEGVLRGEVVTDDGTAVDLIPMGRFI